MLLVNSLVSCFLKYFDHSISQSILSHQWLLLICTEFGTSKVRQSACLFFLPCFPGLSCDQNALGMESGWIEDADVTASSLLNIRHDPGQARLHSNSAWMPLSSDANQILQIHFQDEANVSAVVIQGHPELNYWVTKYRVAFSLDGQTWRDYPEVSRRVHTGASFCSR